MSGTSLHGRKNMPVRAFVEDDIPQVADLYWAVMRERRGPAPPAVRSFFQELYFTNPWMDSSLPSLAYDEKGKIVGFLGVVPRKMSVRGRSIRVAFGGGFMVDPKFRSTLAGLHLLNAYLAGGQDVSQTDSANDISRALLLRLGFTTILPFSVHWVRPLRPARYAAYVMSQLSRSALSTSLEFATRPFCSAMDGIASRLSSSPFRLTESRLQGAELDVETLLGCMSEFRSGYSLWPEYDLHSLNWLLTYMERMKAHGDLRKVVLRDDARRTFGWYIYYRDPGAIGEVVQIGGPRQFTKAVLDHLFYDAWSHGVIGLHGVVDRRLMDDFSEKNCLFTCRGGWTVAHSRNPELLALLNSGDAFLSRLDGEWCLAFGG
jgi:RimJ/RimL family protein N-acetyltransferase